MKILGIETSCDETAASVVTDNKEILSNIIWSQVAEHSPYGGVVPEIASRAHITHIDKVIRQAMDEAGAGFNELDGIAVTAGPGLIGGVIVGLMTAKGIAAASGKSLIAVNHLEGHALTVRLTSDIDFPFLLLLVSGGHCQILAVEGAGKYKRLGTTLDDALGEAFDKTAKMLGLGYPGGPAVEKCAAGGNPHSFDFPKPLYGKAGCNFSFSGLKTAIFRKVQELDNIQVRVNDICASFQYICGEILTDRMRNAIAMFEDYTGNIADKNIVIAGGVAANMYLRGQLEKLGAEYGYKTIAPPIRLCTDNAAMIAWAGIERINAGFPPDNLSTTPKPRWDL